MKKPLLIGAHPSAAGGSYNALMRGNELGCTVIQFFTSNQKQWRGRIINEEEIAKWNQLREETGIVENMSHSSYLINLGSPKKSALAISRKAFKEEIERCHLLELPYLNFHPGAAVGSTEEECLNTIVESLLEMESIVEKGSTRLLLETTAGQGTSVGHRFEHLAYILEHTHKRIPMGVCIDTCHIFSAGYDIRTEEDWDETLGEFDRVIGLKHLYAFHLNDSKIDFGLRRDHHENIGKGKIGSKCFEVLMNHPKVRDLPKYLETPNGEKMWKQELNLLREFAHEKTAV